MRMSRIAIRKDAAIYLLISQEQKIYYCDLNKFFVKYGEALNFLTSFVGQGTNLSEQFILK